MINIRGLPAIYETLNPGIGVQQADEISDIDCTDIDNTGQKE